MMTQKEKNELLTTLWNNPSVRLIGYRGAILGWVNRNQAFNEFGVALYDSYQFILPYETEDLLLFSAEDLEAFARTW